MSESFCGSGIFSYLCTVALLAHLWAVGGLMYEKDVFERLSLWFKNFANSTSQPIDDNRSVCVVRSIFFLLRNGSCWRGLTALSILCEVGNAKAFESRVGGRNRHLRLFCVV